MNPISAVKNGLVRDFKAAGRLVRTRTRGSNLAAASLEPPYFTGSWQRSQAARWIDEESALTVPAVWAAVTIITSAVAGLPKDVYQEILGEKVQMETPLTKLLTIQPNGEMSSMFFWEQLVGHEVLYGNAYMFVVKTQDNRPLELWPIDPKRVRVGRAGDGVKYYEVDGPGPLGDVLKDFSKGGEVIHIPGYSLNGLVGLSPIRLMAESIGLAKASEGYSTRFFDHDSTPRGILSTEAALTQAQADQLKANWEERHSGINAGGTAVLGSGAKFQQISFNPEDSQLLEQRKFQIAEVERTFHVPPHLLGDVERSTSWGSGIEEQARNFVEFSLNPHILRFEHAINVNLLERMKSNRYIKFNTAGLLRADTFKRFQTHALALQNRIETVNEVRTIEDLPKLPGGDDLAPVVTATPVPTSAGIGE